VLDANADNQLTLDELERAERIIADQIARLRVPEAGNSLRHQSQSPGNRAYGSPRTTGQPNQVAPAPGAGSR
jgi:hypothetical protein